MRPHDALAIGLVGQQPWDAQQGGRVRRHEGADGVAQHLLTAVADGAFAPDVDEGRHDVVGDAGVPVRVRPLQGIEGDRALQVGRVYVHHVVRARGRHQAEDRIGQMAQRVDQPDAPAGGQVLGDEVLDDGRLAGTGLAEDVEVSPASSRRSMSKARPCAWR